MGYGVRLMQDFSKGSFEALPEFSFVEDMKLGFMMFIKSLPFFIAYSVVIGIVTWLSPSIGNLVGTLLNIFVLPILAVHFINKETWKSYFEFDVVKSVFNNLMDYVVAVIKSITLAIVFVVLSIVVVGIPAMAFTPYIFLCDFYARNVQ